MHSADCAHLESQCQGQCVYGYKNHEHAVALHFMHYKFCRIHQSLRVTPVMEAGIADHVWSLAEVVGMIDWEAN